MACFVDQAFATRKFYLSYKPDRIIPTLRHRIREKGQNLVTRVGLQRVRDVAIVVQVGPLSIRFINSA
jgi:hypothetical protein